MNIEETDKRKIINLISSLLPKTKIYLFGSRAVGSHSPGSDIDIAIDGGTKIERRTIAEIRSILEATNIMHKIDVVDFHSVPDRMQKMIKKEGVSWKN
jgi:uncharacterized protein